MESETRKCTDCQNDFTIEPGEKVWFESKNFVLPKRCAGCRRGRREQRRNDETNFQPNFKEVIL